jgi:hypothetical protein
MRRTTIEGGAESRNDAAAIKRLGLNRQDHVGQVAHSAIGRRPNRGRPHPPC